MWVSDSGTSGWAVGEDGIILRFDSEYGEWLYDKESSGLIRSTLVRLWVHGDGDNGVAFAQSGDVLQLEHGKWALAENDSSIVGSRFEQVAISDDGQAGWYFGMSPPLAGGGHGHLKSESLQGTRWIADTDLEDSFAHSTPYHLWMNPNCETGWCFLSDAVLRLRPDTTEWKHHQTSIGHVTDCWVSSNGKRGWATTLEGRIVMLDENTNSWVVQTKPTIDGSLYDIWMNADGTKGSIVGGDGVVLDYDSKTGWQRNESALKLVGSELTRVWFSNDARLGWAFATSGEVFRYRESQGWVRDIGSSGVTTKALLGLAVSSDGNRGFAVGEHEEFIELKGAESTWIRRNESPNAANAILFAAVSTADCKKAWALGGTIFPPRHDRRLSGSDIKMPQSSIWEFSRSNDTWKNLRSEPWQWVGAWLLGAWIHETGRFGWAVGKQGTVFKYEAGNWSIDQDASSISDEDLYGVALSRDGSFGWAVGASGEVLCFDAGEWKWDGAASEISGSDLMAVCMHPDTRESWAVGMNGAILHFERLRGWRRDSDAGLVTNEDLFSVCMSPDGNACWAVGESGVVLNYSKSGGEWRRSHGASQLAKEKLFCVRTHTDWTNGWAVGENGVILQLVPQQYGPISVTCSDRNQLRNLQGRLLIRIAGELRQAEIDVSVIHSSNAISLSLSKGEHFEVSNKEEGTYELEFLEPSNGLLTPLAGKEIDLRISVTLSDAQISTTHAYSTSFYALRPPLWPTILFYSCSIPALLAALVVSGMYSRRIRNLLLHPAGSHALGLIVGKFLVIDVLIHFVKSVRMAFFREYRANLARSVLVRKWESGERYVPPKVRIHGKREDATWSELFEYILRQPKGRVWFVSGESGLGKTALLENWLSTALREGATPLLITLGEGRTPIEEASNLIAQFGELDVSPDVAFRLIRDGGFVILLDSLNQDVNRNKTYSFVRQVTERNTVVAASQFPPDWPSLQICDVSLKRFAREQLVVLLGEKWLCELDSAMHLKAASELPYTAKLLANYLKKNGRLPEMVLDIYDDFYRGWHSAMQTFGQEKQLLNVEKKAWQLFSCNTSELSQDELTPLQLCSTGVKIGALTSTTQGQDVRYRFRHERLHRYFAARYLHRQDFRSLNDWHGEIDSTLGKAYWNDLIQFWAEMKCRDAILAAVKLEHYKGFLLEVGEFHLPAFQIAYGDAIRLKQAGYIDFDNEFQELAAILLTGR